VNFTWLHTMGIGIALTVSRRGSSLRRAR
jgi:hypothetical protein